MPDLSLSLAEGELLDVIALIHAVVTQRVAEAPEFLDDVGHTTKLEWLHYLLLHRYHPMRSCFPPFALASTFA